MSFIAFTIGRYTRLGEKKFSNLNWSIQYYLLILAGAGRGDTLPCKSLSKTGGAPLCDANGANESAAQTRLEV